MGGFKRAVGALILSSAGIAAVALWCAVALATPSSPLRLQESTLGFVHVLYDLQRPPLGVVAIAVGMALGFAVSVMVMERRVAVSARRSDRPRMPLAPKLVMAATRGVYAGPVTVTVVIPAHDEEGRLPATLSSLRAQTLPPDRIIVVADNCSDDTVGVARAAGVEVFETVGNTRKKAGALNQALRDLLPGQGENDLVMVMDADTVLGDDFLLAAVRRMTGDRALMSVGGLFYGEEGGGVLGQFQRNEYTRYARDLRRRRGMVFVLTGTASVFRPRALRAVADERGRLLPGIHGDVYDTIALTEDNELTIALKSLGALVISPSECTVVTEIMTTTRSLWVQRLRWQRGALENLAEYGLHTQTWRYWVQQLGITYGIFALFAYLSMLLITFLALDSWVWFPFWLGIGGVFAVERVFTVWRGGWAGRILAALVLPELGYAAFLGAVHLKGMFDITFGRKAEWHHADAALVADKETAA
ncbi:glycosyltransferase family 2 protein [Nocardioides panacisoli]|uniref:Glycosyltransferase family 2 protein n=1 Tax=Nocardioides panacisoli TaxID=627624 RepID=A0ABP7J735_9ACTN